MPKVDYNKILSEIGEENFIQMYKTTSIKNMCKKIGYGEKVVRHLVSMLNLFHDSKEIRRATIASDTEFYLKREKKTKNTKLIRHGDETYNNIRKAVSTRESKYCSREEYNQHYRKVYIENRVKEYGSWENYQDSRNIKIKNTVANRTESDRKLIHDKMSASAKKAHALHGDDIQAKRIETIIKKYGSLESYYRIVTKNMEKTCMERYGIPYFCLDKSCRRAGNGSDSGPNLKFKELLIKYNLFESDVENREYVIGKKQYDFKLDDTLIEIDPSITHNSTVDMFGKNPKQPEYHLEKTITAIEAGFKCIHIFDWDDAEKVVYRFLCDRVVYARKCSVKEIEDNVIINKFLNENHLQGSCRGASVAIGLYYNDELIQVMTFGKPRYNKKYEYELLRLCSKLGARVVGGAERLFKYFLKKYSPSSIISYCDNAKFTGDIYEKLGFSLKTYGKPSKHWFNLITGQHVTDNLLRERGFDQLFNADYGKGTDNEELMIEHGFVEVFDCGQSVYEYIV